MQAKVLIPSLAAAVLSAAVVFVTPMTKSADMAVPAITKPTPSFTEEPSEPSFTEEPSEPTPTPSTSPAPSAAPSPTVAPTTKPGNARPTVIPTVHATPTAKPTPSSNARPTPTAKPTPSAKPSSKPTPTPARLPGLNAGESITLIETNGSGTVDVSYVLVTGSAVSALPVYTTVVCDGKTASNSAFDVSKQVTRKFDYSGDQCTVNVRAGGSGRSSVLVTVAGHNKSYDTPYSETREYATAITEPTELTFEAPAGVRGTFTVELDGPGTVTQGRRTQETTGGSVAFDVNTAGPVTFTVTPAEESVTVVKAMLTGSQRR